MPACEPWCPVVRAKLREIVAQAPWIQDEQVTARLKTESGAIFLDDKRVDKGEKLTDESLERLQRAELHPHPGYHYGEDVEAWSDVAKPTDVKGAIITETKPLDKAILEGRTRADAAVNSEISRTAIDEGGYRIASDKLTNTDTSNPLRDIGNDTAEDSLRESRGVGPRDPSGRSGIDLKQDSLREAGTQGDIDQTSKSTQQTPGDSITGSKANTMERVRPSEQRADLAGIQDDCDPNCPRRISRKTRLRKLEERQSTVDAYLLDKGSGYFEDVCTCSLSCVVRALSDDPFIRSILTSAALFALGLKLCVELDAWSLPVRL